MPKTMTWVDPSNGEATQIQLLKTTDPVADPDQVYTTVAAGVQQVAGIPDADAPAGSRWAVRGVNTNADPDLTGPISNIGQVAGAAGPVPVSARLWPDGVSLHITFDKPLLPIGAGGGALFHIFKDGVEQTGKSGTVVEGAEQHIYKMTFSAGNEIPGLPAVITADYDGGYLTDVDGNPVAAFSDFPVTNDSGL